MEDKKGDILQKLGQADNVYSSKSQIFKEYIFRLLSNCDSDKFNLVFEKLLSFHKLENFYVIFADQFIEYMKVKKESQSKWLIILLKELKEYSPFLIHFTVEKFVEELINLIHFDLASEKQAKMNLSGDLVTLVEHDMLSEDNLIAICLQIREVQSRIVEIWTGVNNRIDSQIAIQNWLNKIFQNRNMVSKISKLSQENLVRFVYRKVNTDADLGVSEKELEEIESDEIVFRFELLTRIFKKYIPKRGYSKELIVLLIELSFDVNLLINKKKGNSFLEFGVFDIMKKLFTSVSDNDIYKVTLLKRTYKNKSYTEIIGELFDIYEEFMENKSKSKSLKKHEDADVIYVSRDFLEYVDEILWKKDKDRKKKDLKRKPSDSNSKEAEKTNNVVVEDVKKKNEQEIETENNFEKEMENFLEAQEEITIFKKADVKFNGIKFGQIQNAGDVSESQIILISRINRKKVKGKKLVIGSRSKHKKLLKGT